MSGWGFPMDRVYTTDDTTQQTHVSELYRTRHSNFYIYYSLFPLFFSLFWISLFLMVAYYQQIFGFPSMIYVFFGILCFMSSIIVWILFFSSAWQKIYAYGYLFLIRNRNNTGLWQKYGNLMLRTYAGSLRFRNKIFGWKSKLKADMKKIKEKSKQKAADTLVKKEPVAPLFVAKKTKSMEIAELNSMLEGLNDENR